MTTATAPDGDGRITHVYLSDLIPDRRLQARSRLQERTVEKYAKHLRNGGTFDTPIVAALIRGKTYVVDGFHRREAFARAGKSTIEVLLIEMTWDQALYRAGQANQRHGLPLASKDVIRARRMILRGYIGQKRHLKGRERKEIADICAELTAEGCVWTEGGLRQALKKTYPDLYARHWQRGGERGGLRDPRGPDISQQMQEARALWDDFRGKVKALPKGGRQHMVESIQRDLPGLLEVGAAALDVTTY